MEKSLQDVWAYLMKPLCTEGMGGDNHSIKDNIAKSLEVGLMANKVYNYIRWSQIHIIKFSKH